MNIGSGDAADQMVRMMLSGGEVTVRLGASAIKNLAAITIALARNHKTLSGKVQMKQMLQQTRDLRRRDTRNSFMPPSGTNAPDRSM